MLIAWFEIAQIALSIVLAKSQYCTLMIPTYRVYRLYDKLLRSRKIYNAPCDGSNGIPTSFNKLGVRPFDVSDTAGQVTHHMIQPIH